MCFFGMFSDIKWGIGTPIYSYFVLSDAYIVRDFYNFDSLPPAPFLLLFIIFLLFHLFVYLFVYYFFIVLIRKGQIL